MTNQFMDARDHQDRMAEVERLKAMMLTKPYFMMTRTVVVQPC